MFILRLTAGVVLGVVVMGYCGLAFAGEEAGQQAEEGPGLGMPLDEAETAAVTKHQATNPVRRLLLHVDDLHVQDLDSSFDRNRTKEGHERRDINVVGKGYSRHHRHNTAVRCGEDRYATGFHHERLNRERSHHAG